MVGLGSHGHRLWCVQVLPRLVKEGFVEVVGLVDPSQERLEASRAALGLGADACFRDYRSAIEALRADVLLDSTPFPLREQIGMHALERGLHLYAEKPVGSSLEEACRLKRKASDCDRKVAVNMSACFMQDKQSLVRRVVGGDYGKVDFAFAKMSWNYLETVPVRQKVPYSYLLEGGIHMLETLRKLSASNARRVSCHSWTTPWSKWAEGSSMNLFIEMQSGARCVLEGSWTVSATTHPWGGEYMRADCEKGSLGVEDRKVTFWDPERPWGKQAKALPLLEGDSWEHHYLMSEFCRWIRGEVDEHPTSLDDNLQTSALLHSAIESGKSDARYVDVQEQLEAALARV